MSFKNHDPDVVTVVVVFVACLVLIVLFVLAPAVKSDERVKRVSSTAYCLTGRTANGERPVYRQTAAMNGVPFGSQWKLHGGPWDGTVLRINDRGGRKMQFDLAMPNRCREAKQYGRRTVTVERVK